MINPGSAMPSTFFLARLMGLGVPEMLVLLVLLLVLATGQVQASRGASAEEGEGLANHEVRALIVLGVVLAVLGGVLLWPVLAR